MYLEIDAFLKIWKKFYVQFFQESFKICVRWHFSTIGLFGVILVSVNAKSTHLFRAAGQFLIQYNGQKHWEKTFERRIC